MHAMPALLVLVTSLVLLASLSLLVLVDLTISFTLHNLLLP